jgi:hypothetical protein
LVDEGRSLVLAFASNPVTVLLSHTRHAPDDRLKLIRTEQRDLLGKNLVLALVAVVTVPICA